MAKKVISPDQMPGLFSSMVQDFLTFIVQTKGQSIKTQTSYKYAFKLFAIFMIEVKGISFENITFSMMTVDMIESFLNWLAETRNSSYKTINARIAAFNSFAKYAVNHNFEAASHFQHEMSKIEEKRGVDSEVSYFTTQEVQVLFDLPKHNTIAGRRDATLLPFMFATAMRGQEICEFKVRDACFLDNSRTRISILGKGQKRRTISICEDVTFSLKRYMTYRRIIDIPDAYVFNTQNSSQMSVSCLEDIYDKYVKLAKAEHPDLFQFRHYSPHSMRHATGVSMVEAGVPLPVIKVFFGHENISTTEIYAKITQPALEQKVREWNRSFWGTVVEDNAAGVETETDTTEEGSAIPAFLK